MKTFGCRSKFSFLPQRVRWHAYNLLLDGATLKSLLADRVISEALEKNGFTLNFENLKHVRRSREFAEFVRVRQKYLDEKYRDMMLTAIASGSGAMESMTDQTRCKLMETLSELADLSDLPDEERIKAVRSLSQSLASLSNSAKDRQIVELQRKLAEKDAEIARLADSLARLEAEEEKKPGEAGLSEEAIRQAEEKIRLL